MSRCLITGGAGFIGSHTAEAFLKKGFEVRIIDDFFMGRRENLASIAKDIEIIEGDIRDLDTVQKSVSGMDKIIHLAARNSVPRSLDDPLSCNDVNITGTLNILLASRDAGVGRVVFSSSSSVYGDNPSLLKKETLEMKPLSPYAASKAMGEYYCRLFSSLYGLETVVLRFFNVFGPRQVPDSPYSAVIPKFIVKMMKGEAPTIFDDGEQQRDFTYIDNTVQGILCACEAGSEASEKVFNCSAGAPISVNTLVAGINKILKKNIRALYAPPRKGDMKNSLGDISLAREILGYNPSVSFEEGLAQTIDSFFHGRT